MRARSSGSVELHKLLIAVTMYAFSVATAAVLAATVCAQYHFDGEHPYQYQQEYAAKYDHYEPSDYNFDYAVSDPHTGDHKSQWEVKEKGVVRGGYSLLEPDGTTRIVEYIADDHGFRAVVKKIGEAVHPTPHHQTEAKSYGNLYEGQNAISNTYNGYVNNYQQPEIVIEQEPEPQGYISNHEEPAIVITEPSLNGGVQVYHQPVVIKQEPVVIKEEYHQPIVIKQEPVSHAYSNHQQNPVVIKEESDEDGGYGGRGDHYSVEVHGNTGNDEDDSEYTRYDDDHEEAHGDGEGFDGYEEESRALPKAVPFSWGYQHGKPLLPFPYIPHGIFS